VNADRFARNRQAGPAHQYDPGAPTLGAAPSNVERGTPAASSTTLADSHLLAASAAPVPGVSPTRPTMSTGTPTETDLGARLRLVQHCEVDR